ncbi:MAG: transporter [Betaproteobacteria bacterium HGW-Betaproteobacteria-8]|nr:MAG: transporter [Betaproteobacteria bacterium HGW-Betaproteobacteria-8]
MGIRVATTSSCLLLALYASSAQAIDLMEAWQGAIGNDREYAVAEAGHGVVEPRQKQAAALWRPNVVLSAGAGIAHDESNTRGVQFSGPGFGQSEDIAFSTSINSGTSHNWALRATQPLYDPKRRAEQQQLLMSADQSDLDWNAARQSLMLSVAEKYFDLAMTQESLRVLQQQLRAVERLTTEMQDRFKLGATPITDTHESEARLAAVKAQVLYAEMEVETRKNILADSTGLSPERLFALLPQRVSEDLLQRPMDEWIREAESGNADIRMKAIAGDVARQEAKKFTLESSVKLDAIAQAGRDYVSGHGDFGSASNAQTSGLIGVQVSVPLFTGGYRGAKEEEALRLAEKADAEMALARQQVAQAVRATWLNLKAGSGRVQALAQAAEASRLRLDATTLGHQVGDRTTLDVINAENDVANAELALAQAKVNQVLNQIRLAALAGKLDESVLTIFNKDMQSGQ